MDVFTIAGYAVGVVGAVLALTSKTKSNNLADLKERVEILEKEREYARTQHIENLKAIANLEGQLKTYKDIPLQQIAESLKALATSQDAVLKQLNDSARISKAEAESGGMLVQNRETTPLSVKDVSKKE